MLSEKVKAKGSWEQVRTTHQMCETMPKYIKRLAKEILSSSRGDEDKIERPWWWNDKVKVKVMEK